MVQTKIMHDCHRSSKMVQKLVFIILSKVKLMFEILDSQSPKFQSRKICTDFQTSLLITSGTCLFLSKGMRLRFQKCTQMCLFWYLVATLDTLYILSLYYHFSLILHETLIKFKLMLCIRLLSWQIKHLIQHSTYHERNELDFL